LYKCILVIPNVFIRKGKEYDEYSRKDKEKIEKYIAGFQDIINKVESSFFKIDEKGLVWIYR